MQAFRYRAATGAGELVEGVVQAGSARAAADELRRQALVPVSVEAATRQALRRRTWSVGRSRGMEAAGTAYRTLALLLAAGHPMERALEFASRHASHPEVAEALRVVRADVRAGIALSEAVRKHAVLGSFAAAVIRSGEESGTLDRSLVRLADWTERSGELRAQVRAALLYPVLMGITAGIGVVVLLVFVVPRFATILGDVGGTLPMSTRMLVGLSRLVVSGWWFWPLLVAGVALGTRAWLDDPANRRRWHAARLGLPGLGPLERDVATSRFASALAVLLQGGTPVLGAVRMAREGVANLAILAALDASTERIARGDGVAESLSGALPPLAVELMAAGEEGGRLGEMCARVAMVHEESAGRSLRTMVRLIEPVLILVFGAVVGFVALAMLQAVYSVNAGIL